MKTAAELIELKNRYSETFEAELSRVSSVIDAWDPALDKKNEICMQLLSTHWYDTVKKLKSNGYHVAPIPAYKDKDIDEILSGSKYVTALITW